MVPLLASLTLAAAVFDLPQIPQLPPIRRDPQITFIDRSGTVIGVRGGRYGPPVDVARAPTYVTAAFVAIEDRRFYEHQGIDAMGVARAIVTDVLRGRAAQGASTITQQLARNLFLNADRTMERKATEAVYAVELERAYTKQQILGLYLSRVYFGSGAYGIEAAAERYYGKPAGRLTLAEAATLAGVVKSPTEYDPSDHPENAARRARLVLDAMLETGAITASQRSRALASMPRARKTGPNGPAQYFVDWLDGQTLRLVGQPTADLVVETTLDAPLELAAASSAQAVVTRYAHDDVEQAALVALDPSGRVRAMVGGVDYGKSPFDRAVEAHRQAGSSWKPFVYLTAMEAGRTPDTLAVDQPVTINGWSPRNFEPEFLGPITLEKALAQSVNTVAAELANEVGTGAVAATAHRVGIVSPLTTEPAMALGADLVTPLEMAQAYDAFSNGGNRVSAYGIERIRTISGRVLYAHNQPPAPAIGNPALGELDRMLRTVIASGTGVKAAIPGHDLAGKTGTTSDFRDAWFCGFTGGLTAVVWMGRDDNSPMRGVTGGSAPAEFWRSFMRVAMKRLPTGPIPPGPPAPPPVPPVLPVSATAVAPAPAANSVQITP
ncbi:MAG: transglycosylase domain-containing protein [Caulobacterales bacterium]